MNAKALSHRMVLFLCGKMWEMAIAAAVAIMRISIGCNAFIFWYVGNAMLLHHAL